MTIYYDSDDDVPWCVSCLDLGIKNIAEWRITANRWPGCPNNPPERFRACDACRRFFKALKEAREEVA